MQRHKLPGVVHIILEKENKILLQRRFNTGFEDGNYDFASGHVNENESFKKAAIREAKEELDVQIKEEDLLLVHTQSRIAKETKQERIGLFFKTTKWKGEPKIIEPDKCDELKWFDKDNLPKNTIEFVKVAFEKIKKKETYSDWGWN